MDLASILLTSLVVCCRKPFLDHSLPINPSPDPLLIFYADSSHLLCFTISVTICYWESQKSFSYALAFSTFFLDFCSCLSWGVVRNFWLNNNIVYSPQLQLCLHTSHRCRSFARHSIPTSVFFLDKFSVPSDSQGEVCYNKINLLPIVLRLMKFLLLATY